MDSYAQNPYKSSYNILFEFHYFESSKIHYFLIFLLSQKQMSETAIAKLKYVLPSLRSLNETALAKELDKLSVQLLFIIYLQSGSDLILFYKQLVFFFVVLLIVQNQALQLKRKNILFVGAPGSGKGTYSRIISPVLMVCCCFVFIIYLDSYIWFW